MRVAGLIFVDNVKQMGYMEWEDSFFNEYKLVYTIYLTNKAWPTGVLEIYY